MTRIRSYNTFETYQNLIITGSSRWLRPAPGDIVLWRTDRRALGTIIQRYDYVPNSDDILCTVLCTREPK